MSWQNARPATGAERIPQRRRVGERRTSSAEFAEWSGDGFDAGDNTEIDAILGCDSWGFRETTLLAELAWTPADHLTVTPYLAYSDHLNGHFRHSAHYYADEEAKHSVAQLYGGIAVEFAF